VQEIDNEPSNTKMLLICHGTVQCRILGDRTHAGTRGGQ